MSHDDKSSRDFIDELLAKPFDAWTGAEAVRLISIALETSVLACWPSFETAKRDFTFEELWKFGNDNLMSDASPSSATLPRSLLHDIVSRLEAEANRGGTAYGDEGELAEKVRDFLARSDGSAQVGSGDISHRQPK